MRDGDAQCQVSFQCWPAPDSGTHSVSQEIGTIRTATGRGRSLQYPFKTCKPFRLGTGFRARPVSTCPSRLYPHVRQAIDSEVKEIDFDKREQSPKIYWRGSPPLIASTKSEREREVFQPRRHRIRSWLRPATLSSGGRVETGRGRLASDPLPTSVPERRHDRRSRLGSSGRSQG